MYCNPQPLHFEGYKVVPWRRVKYPNSSVTGRRVRSMVPQEPRAVVCYRLLRKFTSTLIAISGFSNNVIRSPKAVISARSVPLPDERISLQGVSQDSNVFDAPFSKIRPDPLKASPVVLSAGFTLGRFLPLQHFKKCHRVQQRNYFYDDLH